MPRPVAVHGDGAVACGERDRGFTLVELVVVIIIIGVLAAIAVPVLTAQRGRAVDTSMRSDLRTVATKLEEDWAISQSYGSSTAASSSPRGLVLSAGNLVEVIVRPASGGFCLVATRAAGAGRASQDWFFDSTAGGLLPADPDGTPSPAEGTACT
jgi:prepilin-type N-terminal cleavage/methylation domain-containing protein